MKRQISVMTLLILMLGLVVNVKAQTWDFATVSSTDKANLDTDKTNWTYDSSNNRWLLQAVLDNEPLKANNVELEFTKGILFTTGAADQIRVDAKKSSLTLNNKAAKITISNVKAGQVLTIVAQSSSSSTARKLEVTNIDVTSGFTEGTDKTTNTGKVQADGTITINSTGGMYVYSISVTDEKGGDPDDSGSDTPSANDYSVSKDLTQNQVILTLKDNSRKYYNTNSVSEIAFDNADVTVKQAAGDYTFENMVANISFAKASEEGGKEGSYGNETGKVEILEARGWLESAFVKFKKFDGAKNYHVYIKGGQYADYIKIDDQLVREYSDYGRADIVGLKAASDYAIKIVPVDENKTEIVNAANEAMEIFVKNYSREGFAFMNGVTPGAYNSDGTLKQGAKVFYVTKNTAKTITTTVKTGSKDTNITECVGIQAIVDAYQKGYDTTPIAFRFIGLVTKDDLDGISSSAEGLQVKGKNADSELNLTFEGIGDDATVKNFGFLVRNAKSVEFRNFGIMRCMDDGISLDTDNSNIWVHHMDVFYGPNGGGDHAKGDGSVDVKSDSKYVTVSYNRFWDTGKTNMFGMKSESGPNYISYDHNWFDHSDSRHPRIRTMSVHVWNNYFDNVAKYGVGATSGASVFVENNYFLKTKKPILSSLQGTDALGSGTFSDEEGGIIKAYGNYFDKTIKNFSYYTQKNPASTGYDAYEVDSRDETVPTTEKTVSGGHTYDNFDTDASKMYTYEAVAAEDVPALVTGYYGAGRLNHGDFAYSFLDNVGDDNTDSAYDSTLGGLLDNYKSALIGIFGDENASSGEQGSEGTEQGGEQGGDNQGGDTTPEGTITCSFPYTGSFFSITGNESEKYGTVTVDGQTYSTCLKIESSTSIKFTLTASYKMTLYFGYTDTANIKVDGVKKTSTTTVYTETLGAGEHELTKADSMYLFYIKLEPTE